MISEERTKLELQITDILKQAISDDYTRDILESKDAKTGKTLMEDIVENVLETSAWKEEGYYNEDDIRLAIGREMTRRVADWTYNTSN